MYFGGIQKNSMIDYPGKICCVLFVWGCNYECPFCHNASLVKVSLKDVLSGNIVCADDMLQDVILAFLKKRVHLLDGVVLSGGEPTLQHDIMATCHEIKELGYAIKLDTNGSQPDVIQQLIDHQLIDYVAMDIKTSLNKYPTYIGKKVNPFILKKSVQLIMDSGLPYEFRTTCVNPIVEEHDIEAITHLIKGAGLYILQKFIAGPDILKPDDLNLQSAMYDDHTLTHFQSIAAPLVKSCMIR